MPEFILNSNAWFHSLDEFTQGYVEAMFFTNCDTGSEEEYLANRLGVARLTEASRSAIVRDCDAFKVKANIDALFNDEASPIDYFKYGLDPCGRDFWFTRQGHGVGFWCRDQLDDTTRGFLDGVAKSFGECYPEIYRGWVYYR